MAYVRSGNGGYLLPRSASEGSSVFRCSRMLCRSANRAKRGGHGRGRTVRLVSSLTPNLHNGTPPAERSCASKLRANESSSSASHALKTKSENGLAAKRAFVRRPPRRGRGNFFHAKCSSQSQPQSPPPPTFRAVDFCCSLAPVTHALNIAPHRLIVIVFPDSRVPTANSIFRRPPQQHENRQLYFSSSTVNTPFITI